MRKMKTNHANQRPHKNKNTQPTLKCLIFRNFNNSKLF